MPYIFGTVTQQDGRNSSAPCMNFQVTCPDHTYVQQAINLYPPYFFGTVGVGEYVLQVIGSSGAPTTVVAFPKNDMDAVVLNVTVQ